VRDIRLTFISKPDCHLCEAARKVVDDVVAELGSAASIAVEELSILEHPDLYDKYVEEIPVVLLDGKVHNIWRIDPVRLKTAILEVGE
jgi:glutaredoxin